MKLVVGNCVTKVTELTEPEVQWLSRLVRSYEHVHASPDPDSDGRFEVTKDRPVTLQNAEIPTGIVPLIRRSALEAGLDVQLVDTRVPPCQPDPNADLRWLRDDQREAVEAAVQQSRGLIQLTTAAGKSEVIIGLTRVLPCRWLVLTQRTSVAVNMSARFDRRNREHGIISLGESGLVAGGYWTIGERLTCATFQGLLGGIKNRAPMAREVLLSAEALAVDEAHGVAADTCYQIAMATPNAYHRYGTSATPLDRSDGRNLLVVAAIGPIIHKRSAATFMDAGLVARPLVEMVSVDHDGEAPATWDEAYNKLVVDSVERNTLLLDEVERAAKPCLVFVVQLRHGVALRRAMVVRGLRAEFLWGRHHIDYRTDAFARLCGGELDVIIANTIAEQGVDLPELRTVVVAGAGRSVIATLQRLGRGMRLAPGKSAFKVIDLADRNVRWLERHSRARERAYKRDFDVTHREPTT